MARSLPGGRLLRRSLASLAAHPMDHTWAKRDLLREMRAASELSACLPHVDALLEAEPSFELSSKDLTLIVGALASDEAASSDDFAKAAPIVGDLVERLRAAPGGLDGLAYAVAIRSLAVAGSSSAALSLLDEALEAGESLSPALPAFAFEGAFRAVAAAQSSGEGEDPVADRVVGLLDRMVAAGIPRDSSTYAAAIQACAASSNSEGALAILDRMTKENIWPTAKTLAHVATLLASESKWDEVRQVYTHMHALKLTVPAETYALHLNGCILQKRVNEAADVFVAFRRRGYEPTEEVSALLCVNHVVRAPSLYLFLLRRVLTLCTTRPLSFLADVHLPHERLHRSKAAAMRGGTRSVLADAGDREAVRGRIRCRTEGMQRGRAAR